MHSYSIDRDLRVRVAVYIFIISIVISVILNDLLQNPTRLKTMSENAKKSAIIDASKRFADALESKILISATAQTGAK